MLNQQARLPRSKINLVLKTGRLQENPFLKVRVKTLRAAEEPSAQLAVLVPAASAPLASARQRIKRRTRHILQELLPRIKSGQEIAVILKKPALGLSFEKLKEKISEILQQAKIL